MRNMHRGRTSRVAALTVAERQSEELYSGVFYKNPNPPPTYDALLRERQNTLAPKAVAREHLLDAYVQR